MKNIAFSLLFLLVGFICFRTQSLVAQTAQDFIDSGLAKSNKSDFEGAIMDYTSSIKLDSNNKWSWHNRGGCKLKLGLWNEGIADIQEAIKIDPFFAEAFGNLGIAKSEIGDYKGALIDINKAIELKPSYYMAYLQRGDIKVDLGDYRGAMGDYSKALELSQTCVECLFGLAFARGELKDYSGSITAYTKLIELQPNDGHSYYNRGIMQIKLGKKSDGCLDLSKAGELGYMDAYAVIRINCK